MKKAASDEKGLWKEGKRESLLTRRGVKSLTKLFLENLVDLMNSPADSCFDRRAVFRKAYGFTGGWPKSKISKSLHNLKASGYLAFEKNNSGQVSVVFTDKAKLKVLDKICEKTAADNKNRFVSFDIPEKMSSKRNQFRQAIKQLGFKQIQKSLWVTNRNVGELVEMAAYTFGVEQYVIYIVAEKSDIDGVIDKLLGS